MMQYKNINFLLALLICMVVIAIAIIGSIYEAGYYEYLQSVGQCEISYQMHPGL